MVRDINPKVLDKCSFQQAVEWLVFPFEPLSNEFETDRHKKRPKDLDDNELYRNAAGTLADALLQKVIFLYEEKDLGKGYNKVDLSEADSNKNKILKNFFEVVSSGKAPRPMEVSKSIVGEEFVFDFKELKKTFPDGRYQVKKSDGNLEFAKQMKDLESKATLECDEQGLYLTKGTDKKLIHKFHKSSSLSIVLRCAINTYPNERISKKRINQDIKRFKNKNPLLTKIKELDDSDRLDVIVRNIVRDYPHKEEEKKTKKKVKDVVLLFFPILTKEYIKFVPNNE